ncbi:MAG: hypothetical protein K2H52_13230 [Lachnospiraceae bacterium]|nr:hypothetical protein [Lachnospiraceae bacterium]MDE6184059.1 hypothetical protein [Lachnospiraceae bacterium]
MREYTITTRGGFKIQQAATGYPLYFREQVFHYFHHILRGGWLRRVFPKRFHTKGTSGNTINAGRYGITIRDDFTYAIGGCF